MNTATRILFLASFSACLSACATSSAPAARSDAKFVLPDIPAEPLPQGIPYPKLDEQTQIDQLGLQIARLERELGVMQTRVRQLERQNKIRVPTGKSTVLQRIDDRMLKSRYLQENSGATDLGDPVQANETRLYNQAVKFYQRGQFASAAAILREADGGNGSEVSRRNMYLLLQSQQRLGNCESVIEIGGRYANRFRGSAQAPDALYSIAQCQYDMQQKDIARNTWRKLIQTYPDSAAAKRAVMRLKQR